MTTAISTACSPRWSTTPAPGSPTIGAEVRATGALLGRRFIPWQTHAANVAGTLTDRGRFRYRRVVIVVPRRAGKTFLIVSYAMTVTRRRAMARAFYANHRRETGAAMWRDDWFPIIEQSPLHPRFVNLRRANGSEAITWKHNRSTFRLLPPDGDAMRSFQSDLAFVDEAREFTMSAGEDFEAAAFPTQATGAGGQFWIVSNAGDMRAEWLRKWRDLGRASVDNPDSQICYIEYAAPDGADPDDPATWRAAHPGLSYHVDEGALAADQESMTVDRFAAEYLGVWPETLIDQQLLNAWRAAVDDTATVPDPVVFALELSIDRDRFCIVATGGRGNRCTVELLDDRPHGSWVVPRVGELARKWRPRAIVWDAGGPVAALAPELFDLAANCVALNTRDVAAAAGAAHDATLAGLIGHRDDPVLDAAVAAARRRSAGGAWLFDRRQPEALPWIAATLARWVWSDQDRARPTVH